MSAIARYFLHQGLVVGGYDRTPSELTRKLEEEGAQIHYEENVDLIPEACKDKETTLVIYTPAIPAEHKELVFFHEGGFDIQKRAQVLGTLTRSNKGLCVAGTHGKTTTSSMAAHLLHQSSVDCNAFLGGITKNYGTNYILSQKSDYVVIEADEFDRSFHHLTPLRTVVTAVDADHLDIYGTYDAYRESFSKYLTLVRAGGDILLHTGLESKLELNLQPGVKVHSYSRDEGEFHAANIRTGNGDLIFDFVSPLGNISDVELGVPVPINVENAVAAMAMAQMSGASENEIKEGVKNFRGCDRRFDFHLRTPEKVYLSDYAHHPEELRQCALSLKSLYADRRIAAIFQPHLYTRTRDFYKEFAQALSLFDDVWLTEIYPAREQPIPGVTSRIIADEMKPGVCRGIVDKGKVPELVSSMKNDIQVLLTVGAGDLEDYVGTITEILEKK